MVNRQESKSLSLQYYQANMATSEDAIKISSESEESTSDADI